MSITILIKILFTIYCLATLSFFQPFNIVGAEVAKAISYTAMVAILFLAVSQSSESMVRHQSRFGAPLRSLLFFIGISIFMPTISFFDQSLSATFIATIPYFSYSLYLALRKFGIEKSFFYRLIFAITTTAVVTHLINLYTFPLISFGVPEDEYEFERGGVRLTIIGFNFVIVAFLIALTKFKERRSKRWLLLLAACYTVILFSYTRQHIAVCSLFIFIMLMSIIKRKLIRFTIALALIAGSIFIIPKITLFQQLIKLTLEQRERNEYANIENVRISAAKYYGYEAFKTPYNRVFGNGVPSYHSKWGDEIKRYADTEHVYMADVGWFGFYWQFGLFAVLSMGIICCMAIFPKKQHSLLGKYYFAWLMITSLINGALLYQYEIVVTIIVMCIIDYENEHTIKVVRPVKRVARKNFWASLFDWRKVRREQKILERR